MIFCYSTCYDFPGISTLLCVVPRNALCLTAFQKTLILNNCPCMCSGADRAAFIPCANCKINPSAVCGHFRNFSGRPYLHPYRRGRYVRHGNLRADTPLSLFQKPLQRIHSGIFHHSRNCRCCQYRKQSGTHLIRRHFRRYFTFRFAFCPRSVLSYSHPRNLFFSIFGFVHPVKIRRCNGQPHDVVSTVKKASSDWSPPFPQMLPDSLTAQCAFWKVYCNIAKIPQWIQTVFRRVSPPYPARRLPPVHALT